MDMQAWRRHLPAITRWVLACLLLTVTAAVVNTFTQRSAYAVGCASFGAVQLAGQGSADGEGLHPVGHTLDCPLCLPFMATPPALPAAVLPPAPARHGLVPRLFLRVTLPALAPLPARGPPRA